jgi:hypothetical protein
MIGKFIFALRAVCLGAVATAALSAAPILVLNPVGGALSGAPGSTVGWGFTLSNTTNWIEVVQAQFCLDAGGGPFNPCFNASNQFTDIISGVNDVIVGPAGSVTQAYLAGTTGVGSFAIAPGAVIGSSVVGNIVLTYNTFDNDPNAGGNQIGGNLTTFSAASVTASNGGGGGGGVPEPATLGLVGFALISLAGLKMRRRT